MEIIFVLHSLFGGGAERVITLLSENLSKKKINVTFITDTFKDCDYTIPSTIRIVPFFKNKEQSKGRFRTYYQIRTVRSELRRNPNAIVVGVMPIMFLIVVVAGLFLRNKKVASDHTSFERPLNWHIKFIRKYVYKLADAVTMLTQADADYLGNWFEKKYVMPNPLAYEPVKEIGNRKRKILAAGRLDVWNVKGFDLLIHAWGKIAAKHPKWYLEIVGKGNQKSIEALKNLAFANNVENSFVLSGFHRDIDRVMRESPIFVLSSRQEGFGLVLIEAMSQGCACISFDCGGRQKEIIDNGANGIIVDNHDVNLLAVQIDKLIKDDEERNKIANQAIEKSKIFNINNITEKWIIMFRHLEQKV